MDSKERPWCYWQIKCQEDGEHGWTCIARIESGRAGPCVFKTKEEAKERCPAYRPEEG